MTAVTPERGEDEERRARLVKAAKEHSAHHLRSLSETPQVYPPERGWHLAALNDGLFIIDKAPPAIPGMVLNVTDLPMEKAQAIVDAHNTRPAPSPATDEMVGVLHWYGEQARLARLIHSEGDAGRHALAADGGERARPLLAKLEERG